MQVVENERALIGGIFINPNKLADVFDLVSIRDFVSENATVAYGAMLSLWKDGQTIAIDTVAHKVGIEKIEWLGNCADVGSAASLKFNAGVIANEARKRRLSMKLSAIIEQTKFTQSEEMLSDILEAYNSEIVSDSKNPDAEAVVARFRESIEKNKKRGYVGIPTGFNFFEAKFIEYIPGHLWMVGGYTSTGKTAFMVESLSRMFSIGSPKVEIISTEMTDEQLMARLTANKTGYGANAIWSGNLVDKHKHTVDGALAIFSGKEYRLHDNIKTIDKVQNVVRKRFLQGGVDIVFIDFIQNLRKPGSGNSYEEKSQIAIDLQNLAKDCKCTIVCLSQITAAVHKGNAGIAEYKGAGELAEACDLGLWLQREKEDKRKLLLEIRKNRHGMLGQQVLLYNDNYTSLSEHDDVDNC